MHIGLLGLLLMTPHPAGADMLTARTMQSVVAVLPAWPGQNSGQQSNRGREAPEGTAVAVLPGGYLATNAHVLGAAKSVDIRLGDGRLIAVKIIGRDPKSDLALLKAPSEFPVLLVAAPPGLGEKVCAIGNQFGLGLSVTCGVVSASGRTNAGFNPVEDFIQTDAAVNPGGSGGALVDADGRLVGLVSAIFTKKSDANIGVNFAASMDLVMRVMTDLRDHGKVIAGHAGFQVGPLSADERRWLSGVKVVKVARDGPALAEGLQAGDVIIEIGGRPVIRPSDVAAALYLHRPGDALSLRFRRGANENAITVRLQP